MFCCQCTAWCHHGDALALSKCFHLRHITHTHERLQAFWTHLISPPPPMSFIFCPTHLCLFVGGPSWLVVGVVGRPWPQALIGVEVHGVHLLPAHLLQSHSCLVEERTGDREVKHRLPAYTDNTTKTEGFQHSVDLSCPVLLLQHIILYIAHNQGLGPVPFQSFSIKLFHS